MAISTNMIKFAGMLERIFAELENIEGVLTNQHFQQLMKDSGFSALELPTVSYHVQQALQELEDTLVGIGVMVHLNKDVDSD